MPINSAIALVEVLRSNDLLTSSQLEELGQNAPMASADPHELARDLIAKGWLTSFQMKHVFQDKASELTLGCTLHFLLTGKPPFPGGTLTEKLLRHQTETPPRADVVQPGVPSPVADTVLKLLAKRPAERFQIPGELADHLKGLLLTLPAETVIGQPVGAISEHTVDFLPGANPKIHSDESARGTPSAYETKTSVRSESFDISKKAPRSWRLFLAAVLIGVAIAAVGASAVWHGSFHWGKLAFSRDGEWLAVAAIDGHIYVYDLGRRPPSSAAVSCWCRPPPPRTI